jgi:uncharacterized protein YcgI (DUF1989 family)
MVGRLTIGCRLDSFLREPMTIVWERVILPKQGLGFTVRRGQHLRVIDLEGQQVVDMALFNAAKPARSSPRHAA